MVLASFSTIKVTKEAEILLEASSLIVSHPRTFYGCKKSKKDDLLALHVMI